MIHYILQLFHEDTQSEVTLESLLRTIKRLLQFCTEKDRRNSNSFREFINSCVICQQYKSENMTSPCSLCPLPVPTAIFTDFTIDFIEGFLKSSGKDVILICCGGQNDKVCTLYGFWLCLNLFLLRQWLTLLWILFLSCMACMHSTVSDRVPAFLSTFGQSCLLYMKRVQLQNSTAYPPLSDGQSEGFKSAYNVIFGAYTKAYGMFILGSHLFRLLEFFIYIYSSLCIQS